LFISKIDIIVIRNQHFCRIVDGGYEGTIVNYGIYLLVIKNNFKSQKCRFLQHIHISGELVISAMMSKYQVGFVRGIIPGAISVKSDSFWKLIEYLD
jgi:hypothetical protein